MDSPIKKDIKTNTNVDEIEVINASNKGLFSRSLKSLKNSTFINFIAFSSANLISTAPKHIPHNKNIAKNTNILFFLMKSLALAFFISPKFLFKLNVFINFAPYNT